MDVAASQGLGGFSAIRGMRAYARQTAFSGFSAKSLTASSQSSPQADKADTSPSADSQSAPRTRSVGFKLGPLAIRYITEEPEVAPGVSWDDLVSEAERIASYATSSTYEAEREVAELRSSLAESPYERLSRLADDSSRPEQEADPASMRKAASAYAQAASLEQQVRPGAVWNAVL